MEFVIYNRKIPFLNNKNNRNEKEMNIEYLRNFIKLTQYKSFSELAKDLPISQSTLSHQISQLEKDFGVILIERTTKKFDLTEAGQILLNYAKKIIKLYDSCKQELIKFSDQKFEEIVISASTIPGSHILPKYIAEFRNLNPNVHFKVLINNSQKSIENLKRGLADFAGIGSFINYDKAEFDYIEIGVDEFNFICSPSHALLNNGTGEISFDSLTKYPFIWRESGSGMRDTFQKQFPNYIKLNIKLEMNDNDSIITVVSESNYISVMSEMMVIKAEKAGLIKKLKIKEYPIIVKRPLYFIKLEETTELSILKKKFWNYISQKTKKR
ncbi:MAG: LysR substrate-binding domain-containing protein [Candidatus Hermodarchaeota archaeon]